MPKLDQCLANNHRIVHTGCSFITLDVALVPNLPVEFSIRPRLVVSKDASGAVSGNGGQTDSP